MFIYCFGAMLSNSWGVLRLLSAKDIDKEVK
jgi:hypothetical protein